MEESIRRIEYKLMNFQRTGTRTGLKGMEIDKTMRVYRTLEEQAQLDKEVAEARQQMLEDNHEFFKKINYRQTKSTINKAIQISKKAKGKKEGKKEKEKEKEREESEKEKGSESGGE